MTSSRKRVWLITGASSSFGYRLCLAVLARGDLVVASTASQRDVDRLQTAGAYGIKMESETSFGEIRSKMRAAVASYGRIDFLVNNSEYKFSENMNAYGPSAAYETNSFSYTAIQVTNAVAQECSIRQIVVIAPECQQAPFSQATHVSDMRDNVEATAQLFATEYRSRGVRVLLVKPGDIYQGSGSLNYVDDARATVERIIGKVREGGPVEPGFKVM